MTLALTTGNMLGLGLIAGAFVIYALVVSMVIPRFKPDFPGSKRGVWLFILVTLVFFVGTLAAVEGFAKEEEEHAEAAPAATTEAPAADEEKIALGKTVFESAGCESCHTLADAGSTGTVGPNLDEVQPAAEDVQLIVSNGRGGMPASKENLEPEQIEAVALYVSSVAGQ
jgi:mono/diheme cytochrome c family protein